MQETDKASYKFETTSELLAWMSKPEFLIDGHFKGKDIISIEQFTQSDIWQVMELASYLETLSPDKLELILVHKSIAIPFWEPSTRTFSSFKLAAESLGAHTLAIQGMWDYSSVNKGETLADTIKTYEALGVDAIALRHPDKDAALIAALSVGIPILNGGSGAFEHPTQALLDYYTILRETTLPISQLHLIMVGDLKNGRTVHSLVKLFALMGGKTISLVSPAVVKLPTGLKNDLLQKGLQIYETTDIHDIVGAGDVFYITRVQKERFTDLDKYQQAQQGVILNLPLLGYMKPTAVIMHPLPRVGEIDPAVDHDPRAAYFRQVKNGVAIRRALFSLVINGY